MNLFKQCFCLPTRTALVFCIVLAIYGCSGSSSPTSNPVSNEQAEGSDGDTLDASATTADTEILQQTEPVGAMPISDSDADNTDLQPDVATNGPVDPSVTTADAGLLDQAEQVSSTPTSGSDLGWRRTLVYQCYLAN